jgi:diguanylate cyclase (GGDEF)-like protein/PAS domain S-box-containing protein
MNTQASLDAPHSCVAPDNAITSQHATGAPASARTRDATVGDLKQHFDSHPIPMVVYDWETLVIVISNRAADTQYGYAPGELEGQSVLRFRRAKDIAAFHAARAAIPAAPGLRGSVGDWTHVRKDGSELQVRIHYQIIGHLGRVMCLVSYLDVTELLTARQEALRSKRMLEAILNSVPLSVYWKDRDSRYLGCNAAFASEVGLSDAADVVGMTDGAFPWGRHEAEIKRTDAQALASPRDHFSYHKRIIAQPAGDERWYAQSKVALHDDSGSVVGVLAVHEDITAQKLAEANLRVRSRALDACHNAVLVTRPGLRGNNTIEYANPAFERITGYTSDDWAGRDCAFLQREDRDQPGLVTIRAALQAQQDVETIVRNYRADGQMFLNHLLISPVRDEEGAVTHHIAVLNDVTEVMEARRKLEFQANFDALTELPNRSHFMARLKEALNVAAARGHTVSVGFLDLDDFKVINDSLGHNIGDELLKEAARRLQSAIPDGGMVARYGGDEFALFVPGAGDGHDLATLVTSISGCLAGVAYVEGHPLELVCSFGLCTSPQHGSDAHTLIKRADAAMYQAKSVGRGAACIYDDSIGARIDRRLRLLTSLRRAVRNKEFSLVFQPQVDVRSGRIEAVEALIRWTDPETGQAVSPAEFIPLAEESALIVDIGDWVLKESCCRAKMLALAGFDVKVAVNVSPRQFADGSISARLAAILAELGLRPDAIELEITEGMLTTRGFAPLIRHLADAGTTIAVDDFGTGYSNLSVLQTVRPNRIKLDMSLVHGIGAGPQGEALIHAVLSLGKAFGAEVLAEGVETQAQRKFLSENGCHAMQGYLFHKPLTFDALMNVLRARPERPAMDDQHI